MADHDRVWTSTGETANQVADRMAGSGGQPHPSAAATPAPKAPGPSIHPSAKGVYGAPISAPILK